MGTTATARITEPKVRSLDDVDTFIITADSDDWGMQVLKPEVIVREDGMPIDNPEKLAKGDNVFRRAAPGSGKKTKCWFKNTTSAPTGVTNNIHVIPPKP